MTDIITIQEGVKKLKSLEARAERRFRYSGRAFTDAMLALYEIREERLWMYAVDEDGVMFGDYEHPRFKEDYLYHFAKRINRSVSSLYEHFNTIDSWRLLPRRQPEELREVGIQRARPVQDLVHVDGRSGEIKTAPPEVIASLPGEEDDDPLERISQKVEEVYINPPEPMPASDIRRSFKVDTGIEPDISVWETKSQGVWASCGAEWDGAIIPAETWSTLPDELKDHIIKRLKAQPYNQK